MAAWSRAVAWRWKGGVARGALLGSLLAPFLAAEAFSSMAIIASLFRGRRE